MRVDLDARVRTMDGHDAGTVDAAVINPETGEVTGFVVGTGGLLGRDVVVPLADLERADKEGGVLRLRLTRDQLSQLSDYVPSGYVAPPADWVPPAYGYPLAGYLWPTAYACAYNPATCTPAEETEQGRAPEVEIDKGALVLDSRGDDVGVVDDLRFDQESGRLRGVVVRVGGTLQTLFGGGESVEIDARQIDRVDQNVVHLNVDKDAVGRLSHW